MNSEKIKNVKSFKELLDLKYGQIGTERRNNFEEKVQYFLISEIKKQTRETKFCVLVNELSQSPKKF